MEKEFVPYEQVSSLIALGFNEPVIAHRQNGLDICLLKQPEVLLTDLSMILYQQAFRWFDYSTEWSGFIVPSKEEGCFEWWIQNYEDPQLSIESEDWYRKREEAELACLTKLIKIVETKSE